MYAIRDVIVRPWLGAAIVLLTCRRNPPPCGVKHCRNNDKTNVFVSACSIDDDEYDGGRSIAPAVEQLAKHQTKERTFRQWDTPQHQQTHATTTSERPPPCSDLNPNCPSWADRGECTLGADYMNLNCPLSCNRCNPAITASAASSPTIGGVPQRSDFSHPLSPLVNPHHWSPLPRHVNNNNNTLTISTATSLKQLTGYGKEKIRTAPYIQRRIREVITATGLYITNMQSVFVHDGNDGTGYTVLPEMCQNRHSYCALWAFRGLCEFKVRAMREVCAPACHVCPFVYYDGQQWAFSPPDWKSSPYERLDMAGIWEALEEDRVVVSSIREGDERLEADPDTHVNTGIDATLTIEGLTVYVWKEKTHSEKGKESTTATVTDENSLVSDDDYAVYTLPLAQLETSVTRLEVGTEAAINAAKVRRRPERALPYRVDADANSMDGPVIVQMDKFLSPKECEDILSLVRIVPEHEDDDEEEEGAYPVGSDGFASATVESTTHFLDGRVRIGRNCSRSFYYPPPMDGKFRFRHPKSLERILTRMEMLTGIPAHVHVEMPIRFDKFEKGHFQDVTSHYLDTVLTSIQMKASRDAYHVTDHYGDDENDDVVEELVNGILQNADESMKQWRLQESLLLADSTKQQQPKLMRNARIIGLTIFLSDVEEGGEIVFPHMGNTTIIKAKQGRAILYPTSMSLIGEEEDESVVLDPEFHSNDQSYLVEETGTFLMHNAVKVGTKYIVNIYLKRSPIVNYYN